VEAGRPVPPARAEPQLLVAVACGAAALAAGLIGAPARLAAVFGAHDWPAAAPAVAFAGIALIGLGRDRRRTALWAAAATALMAPAAPSPQGIAALAAIAAALFLAARGGTRVRAPVQWLTLLALGIACAAGAGMALGVAPLHAAGAQHAMSAPTAAALLVLGGGLLAWSAAGPGGRRLPVLPIVLAAGLVGATVATVSSAEHAQHGADAAQAAQARLAAAELEAVTDGAIGRLDDLAVGLGTAEDPEHAAFDLLSGRILSASTLAAIGFVRAVPLGREAAFRRASGIRIAERELDGEPRAGLAAHAHYPALRGLGTDRGLFAPGVDVLSGSAWTGALLADAAAKHTSRASAPVRLPAPLGRSALLVGSVADGRYVIGVLPFATIVERVRERIPTTGFRLIDGSVVLGGTGRPLRAPVATPVEAGGRTWRLAVERPRAAAGETLAIAAITLLLTLVLGLAVRLTTRRERVAVAGRLAAEERSRRLAETSTDMLAVLDENGRIAYLSPACSELLGVAPETLIGRRPRALIHPEDLPHAQAAIADAVAGADRLTVTFRLRRADGSWIWVETRLRIIRDVSGRVLEAHSTVRDISDRMASKRAIEEAEARFRSTFEEAPIGMAITSLDGHFQRVNRALARLLGHGQAELEGRHVDSLTHPEDRAADRAAMASMLAGETDTHRVEKRYLHANGETVWAALSATVVRAQDGAPLYFLSQMQDVTERRRYEAELRHLADHDPLTGLLNRRSFERELERHVALVSRYGARGAAIVLDLDHFKTINDTLGHSAGDELIARVARALRTRLRESDVLARLGGDEFAVLLPEGGRAEAVEVAHGILEAVRGQAVLASSGHARRVSASLGIALFDRVRRLSGEAVLVEADLAMYEAKEAGRDRYAIATPGDDESPLGARISWADLIRDALAEDRFVLHAQPIVDVASGRTGQYELLLRMVDPAGELIAPGAFLPVAERFDLIGEIDRWVVRRAIAMLAEATAAGHDITLEVNLSGSSTGDPELLALVERELGAAGVDPARLIFEITETTAVANIPAAQDFAARLAELGCRFALDDFGAGFGSFYYLKHLPFDYLKIDGEFVRHCASDRTDQLVIQAVVDIARGLGKRTIAEQAGDDATVALLRRLGVDQAQGYHLGRPAPLDEWLDRLPGPCAPSSSASPAPRSKSAASG
jgi:diguanylate cyclase (GGDEF)-like protein/PAS domain S-box-containing protein